MGWTIRIRFPAGPYGVCNVKAGPGIHPASFPVGTAVLSAGVKRPVREVNQSSPSSAEIRILGVISPFHHATWRGVN
jgi:hypothetical protein